jgi:hypothetical protein
LRGQKQEHERHREAERDRCGIAADLFLQRDLGPFEAEAGRQVGRQKTFFLEIS